MSILYFTYPLGILLILVLAIGLGIFLTRRFHLSWRLWWIGAAAFILSQVGHIPFNIGVTALFNAGVLPSPPESWNLAFNTIFLGLSAGMWEEWTRYAVLRWWAKDARSWSQGLLFGAGHGGIEALLIGGLATITFISLLSLRSVDLSAVIPPEQLDLVQQQVNAYWGAGWVLSLLPAVERAVALSAHLSFALLVMQTFIRGQIRWTWLAVLWHAVFDMVAVYFSQTTSPYITELILVLMVPINLAIIFGLRRVQPLRPPEEEPLPPPPPPLHPESIGEAKETSENLDRTRYDG